MCLFVCVGGGWRWLRGGTQWSFNPSPFLCVVVVVIGEREREKRLQRLASVP